MKVSPEQKLFPAADLIKMACKRILKENPDIVQKFWVNPYRGGYKVTFYLDTNNPEQSTNFSLSSREQMIPESRLDFIYRVLESKVSKHLPPKFPELEIIHA